MINTYHDPSVEYLESIITLELESSISRNIPIPWENNNLVFEFCQNSIDGLICLYNKHDSVIIFNPTTRWYQTLPPSTYQQQTRSRNKITPFKRLTFGKDQINGLYKPVWFNDFSESTATCEVFDFRINAWRFVEPSSPKLLRFFVDPVYLNGLLYCLTLEGSVVSFDLHTEIFEIVCESVPHIDIEFFNLEIFNLDDNLCVSSPSETDHVIWSWNLEEKTWKQSFFIDLFGICPKEDCMCDVRPLGVVEEEKKKLMLCDYDSCCDVENRQLVLYESHNATPYRRVVPNRQCNNTICYFQSLISIL